MFPFSGYKKGEGVAAPVLTSKYSTMQTKVIIVIEEGE